MKKSLILIGVTALIAVSANAGTLTWTLGTTLCSNLLTAPVKITRLSVSAPAGANVTVSAIDAPSTTLTNVVGSFSQITVKGTNVINSYTDFFGNSILTTNFQLIHETNTITAQTNTFPTRFTITPGTNTTIYQDNVGYFFTQGFTVTNSGSGTATITATYQQ